MRAAGAFCAARHRPARAVADVMVSRWPIIGVHGPRLRRMLTFPERRAAVGARPPLRLAAQIHVILNEVDELKRRVPC